MRIKYYFAYLSLISLLLIFPSFDCDEDVDLNKYGMRHYYQINVQNMSKETVWVYVVGVKNPKDEKDNTIVYSPTINYVEPGQSGWSYNIVNNSTENPNFLDYVEIAISHSEDDIKKWLEEQKDEYILKHYIYKDEDMVNNKINIYYF